MYWYIFFPRGHRFRVNYKKLWNFTFHPPFIWTLKYHQWGLLVCCPYQYVNIRDYTISYRWGGFLCFVDWTTSQLKAFNCDTCRPTRTKFYAFQYLFSWKSSKILKKLLNKKNVRGHFTNTTYLVRSLYTFISVQTLTLLQ